MHYDGIVVANPKPQLCDIAVGWLTEPNKFPLVLTCPRPSRSSSPIRFGYRPQDEPFTLTVNFFSLGDLLQVSEPTLVLVDYYVFLDSIILGDRKGGIGKVAIDWKSVPFIDEPSVEETPIRFLAPRNPVLATECVPLYLRDTFQKHDYIEQATLSDSVSAARTQHELVHQFIRRVGFEVLSATTTRFGSHTSFGLAQSNLTIKHTKNESVSEACVSSSTLVHKQHSPATVSHTTSASSSMVGKRIITEPTQSNGVAANSLGLLSALKNYGISTGRAVNTSLTTNDSSYSANQNAVVVGNAIGSRRQFVLLPTSVVVEASMLGIKTQHLAVTDSGTLTATIATKTSWTQTGQNVASLVSYVAGVKTQHLVLTSQDTSGSSVAHRATTANLITSSNPAVGEGVGTAVQRDNHTSTGVLESTLTGTKIRTATLTNSAVFADTVTGVRVRTFAGLSVGWAYDLATTNYRYNVSVSDAAAAVNSVVARQNQVVSVVESVNTADSASFTTQRRLNLVDSSTSAVDLNYRADYTAVVTQVVEGVGSVTSAITTEGGTDYQSSVTQNVTVLEFWAYGRNTKTTRTDTGVSSDSASGARHQSAITTCSSVTSDTQSLRSDLAIELSSDGSVNSAIIDQVGNHVTELVEITEQFTAHTTTTIREGAQVSDSTTQRMDYKANLLNAGRVIASYIATHLHPDGDEDYRMTTGLGLSINSNTGAVSSYSNLDISSIAHTPLGVFVTTAEGLRRLDNYEDDSTQAMVTYGFTDFGRDEEKRLDNVWVGLRDGEAMTMTAEVQGRVNATHTYNLAPRDAQNPRSNRFIPGRGLVGRFWKLSFRGHGPDFRLYDITVDAAVSKRRI